MFEVLLIAFLSAQVGDTAVTAWRLQQPGFAEVNPFMPKSLPGIITVKAAITVSGAVVALKWRKKHPRLTKVLLVVGAVSATLGMVASARAGSP